MSDTATRTDTGSKDVGELYHEALDAFAETYGVDFERPELIVEEDASYPVVSDFPRGEAADLWDDAYIMINDPEYPEEDEDDRGFYFVPETFRDGVDREDYAIRYGAEDLERLSEEAFSLDVQLKMQMHYDRALVEGAQSLREELLEMYEPFDPELPLRDAGFIGMPELHPRQAMVINLLYYVHAGLDLMSGVHPETGTFRCTTMTDLFEKVMQGGVSRVERAIYHELVHPLAAATPAYMPDDIEERKKISRGTATAASEALPMFEGGVRYGDAGRSGDWQAIVSHIIHTPRKGLEEVLKEEDSEGGVLLDNSHRFAHFVGLSVLRAFEEKHGEGEVYEDGTWEKKWTGRWKDWNDHLFEEDNEPLHMTREYLLNCATTPVGMLGAAQQAFRMRGLDEAAELLEEYVPVETLTEQTSALPRRQEEK